MPCTFRSAWHLAPTLLIKMTMYKITDDTPLASEIQKAQKALRDGDIHAAQQHYAEALTLLDDHEDGPALKLALWVEHIGGLIRLEQFSFANQQVRIYLQQAESDGNEAAEHELMVLLAEIVMAQGDTVLCRNYLIKILQRWGDISAWTLPAPEFAPRFIRLWGLIASEENNYPQSRLLLNEALWAFAEIKHEAGQRIVQNDLRSLALQVGDGAVVNEILDNSTFQDTYELLLVARALRRDARYERAANLIEQRFEYPIEPTWRFPILHELTLLYTILANYEKGAALLPLLDEAAAVAANRDEASAAVARLRSWYSEGFTPTSGKSFEAGIHMIQALIQNGHLLEAEERLLELRECATGPRLAAQWSLVAGELELTFGIDPKTLEPEVHGQQAIAQFHRATQLAQEYSLPELYSQGVRLIGWAYEKVFQDTARACEYWALAAEADKLIAHRQETYEARVRFLEALPDQHDALIEAAASRVQAAHSQLVGPVIVALESARSAAILSNILPIYVERMHDIPLPDDPTGCTAWITQLRRQLPKEMAVWILHATPDHLHHGLLTKNSLHWTSIALERTQLSDTIEALNDYWNDSEQGLEATVQASPTNITEKLAALADRMQLDKVLKNLPPNISRLAIVAGDALGDIPFAALPYPNASGEYLISRFALSSLPCLSALQPIQRRARNTRGKNRLWVHQPTSKNPVEVSTLFRYETTELSGASATPSTVRILMEQGQFSVVRFDCHGKHRHGDGFASWLKLAPEEAEESDKLMAQQFAELSLHKCGTLILGACESGMSQRRGRDERVGFVRMGFVAGAAAILAAQWIAHDGPARQILDSFEQNLRCLPRDVALQKAILTYLQNGSPSLKNAQHPARWACWTLHGDAGLQTKSNWLVRYIRRRFKGD